jgi:GAF domain-containing protein
LNNETTLMLRLARISTELVAEPEEDATVRSIATKAVDFVPAADSAVVTQRAGSRLRLGAATDRLGECCERLELEEGSGPTGTAVWRTDVCLVEDIGHEARWPSWARGARAAGAGSMLAVRLAVGGERLGALSLYSTKPRAFSQTDLGMGFAFAAHASTAMYAAHVSDGLTGAIEARHRIGMAQGILMQRYGIHKDAAFQLLRRYSNATNIKLRDVAVQVAERGDLPPKPSSPRKKARAVSGAPVSPIRTVTRRA